MLLAIDMGNTNITLGVYDGQELRFVFRIATDIARMRDQYAADMLAFFRLHELEAQQFEGAIVSSVVPLLDRTVCDAVEMITGKRPLLVGPGTKTGINIRIDNPAQLGADLLVGAVAAVSKFGSPCVVWDLGTATTVSVVGENNTFLGGAIMAGVATAVKSLVSNASLLFDVSMEAPKSVIGANTTSCMQSGCIYGTAAMIDGMNRRIFNELGYETPIVVTGGLARDILPHCQGRLYYDDNLLLEGLRIIYEKNKK